jgi:DNA invertase Pin-like site-specific DNA recombinase
MDRPGIQAIQKAIREKSCKFKVLIVSAWDRLSRDIGDAFRLVGELEAYNIRLISVRQGEPSDENAKLGRDLFFLLAKRENLTRAGHVLAGQKRWASEGYSPGGVPPYGLKRIHIEDAKGVMRVKYDIDPEKAAVVKNIYAWYAEGLSTSMIAEKLNSMKLESPVRGGWNSQKVSRVLFCRSHREKYTGAMMFNKRKHNKKYKTSRPNPPEEWIICQHAHEAIVPPDIVEAVNRMRETRARKREKK